MKQRVFHGWIVVGAVFAALFIGFGIAYCFAAFFLPLQQEYGARRGDVSLVFSIRSEERRVGKECRL